MYETFVKMEIWQTFSVCITEKWIHEWFYEYSPPILAYRERKYLRPYHSIGRRYIGMARAAPPMQDTFNAFKLAN